MILVWKTGKISYDNNNKMRVFTRTNTNSFNIPTKILNMHVELQEPAME